MLFLQKANVRHFRFWRRRRKQYVENGGQLGRKKGSIKTKEQKEKQYKEVLSYLRKDYSIRVTAKLCNVSVATVQRLKTEFELWQNGWFSPKICNFVTTLSVFPKIMRNFVAQFWKGLWHIEKAHFAYSDRVNLDTSQSWLSSRCNIRIKGRTLSWFVFRMKRYTSKWGLFILLICITRESKPYTEDKADGGSTFYICH